MVATNTLTKLKTGDTDKNKTSIMNTICIFEAIFTAYL